MWLDLTFFFSFEAEFPEWGPLIARHSVTGGSSEGQLKPCFLQDRRCSACVPKAGAHPAGRMSGSSLTSPVRVWERQRRQGSQPGPWE